MSDRRVNQSSQDFASDLSALRDDIGKLTNSVSDLLRSHANDASDQAYSLPRMRVTNCSAAPTRFATGFPITRPMRRTGSARSAPISRGASRRTR